MLRVGGARGRVEGQTRCDDLTDPPQVDALKAPTPLLSLKEGTLVFQLFQFSVCDLGCRLLSYLWAGGSAKKVTLLQPISLVAKEIVQRFGAQLSSLWKSCPSMCGDLMEIV